MFTVQDGCKGLKLASCDTGSWKAYSSKVNEAFLSPSCVAWVANGTEKKA